MSDLDKGVLIPAWSDVAQFLRPFGLTKPGGIADVFIPLWASELFFKCTSQDGWKDAIGKWLSDPEFQAACRSVMLLAPWSLAEFLDTYFGWVTNEGDHS